MQAIITLLYLDCSIASVDSDGRVRVSQAILLARWAVEVRCRSRETVRDLGSRSIDGEENQTWCADVVVHAQEKGKLVWEDEIRDS